MARFANFWTCVHIQKGKMNLEIIRKETIENVIVPLCKSVLYLAFCAALFWLFPLKKTICDA